MILSMTGFGRAESQFRGKKLICEIRSLNSKAMDLNKHIIKDVHVNSLVNTNTSSLFVVIMKVQMNASISTSMNLSQLVIIS